MKKKLPPAERENGQKAAGEGSAANTGTFKHSISIKDWRLSPFYQFSTEKMAMAEQLYFKRTPYFIVIII
ncbi:MULTISPECIES: hypothetical protein [Bacillus]|uniref:hypothetical protein n=1 Tax=Bacillus TaxID=1386 RepID=UPI0007AF356D|nr:hypothetical protein [Bacillus subtilis]MCM3012788.1 hypothetical protein [Bacillus subtilis]MCM3525079.1 hypothetical protein [Bacillus subtilis]MDX7994477.1 hypothetical protein [Bacillus subtilis]PJM64121.1 hypothetical protein BLX91_13715 [Bacillus subtilis]WMW44670.1 hypothetical protein RFN65_07590 [Bacillus subtilis]